MTLLISPIFHELDSCAAFIVAGAVPCEFSVVVVGDKKFGALASICSLLIY